MKVLEKSNVEIVDSLDAITALEERADHVSRRLAMAANAKRLLILCYLAKAETDPERDESDVSVGELQGFVGLGQSALSQHLARLREAKMVATRRHGQTIFYSIGDDETRMLMKALYDTFCADI